LLNRRCSDADIELIFRIGDCVAPRLAHSAWVSDRSPDGFLTSAKEVSAPAVDRIRPFRINTSQADLYELAERLTTAR
jgi:hypothetical protein